MNKQYSCIIAAYNENPRILEVLKAIISMDALKEIIVVDDGSKDGTPEIIKVNFPQIKLIVHEVNKGKTAAIRTAVNIASQEDLLLLDADLVGLKAEELIRALTIFEEHNLDCLVLLTEADKYNKLVRKIFKGTSYVAGDRVLRKSVLQAVLADNSLKNYGLEIAQNRYLLRSRSSVEQFQLSAIDLGKSSKYGFITGTLGEIKMWRDIFRTAGFKFLREQRKLFSKKILR